MSTRERSNPPEISHTGRWMRNSVVSAFFVQGFLFASWTAHIPQLQQHLGLNDGRLGLALLGAPVGSVLAIGVAARMLPRVGSRPMVRVALLGRDGPTGRFTRWQNENIPW